MSLTSKTGLSASPTKKIYRLQKAENTIQLKAIARPAPFVLKPFAGLYNPYPYGCSLLCNHPTDRDAKELLRKAKDTWVSEGKNLLLVEEIEAIRASLLKQLQSTTKNVDKSKINADVDNSVPEELFRRYTETDSRPLTPAPTLASGATRASGSRRRCFTPDPLPTNEVREKTLLVLDLRRSHSQETLSWYGSSLLPEPPLIRIQRVPTRAGSYEDLSSKTEELNRSSVRKGKSPSCYLNTMSPTTGKRPKSSSSNTIPTTKSENGSAGDHNNNSDSPLVAGRNDKKSINDNEDDDGFVKRRGKRRRKKGRDASRGPPAFQNSIDPETQVATVGNESHNPSARSSLVPDIAGDDDSNLSSAELQREYSSSKNRNSSKMLRYSKSLDIDSYLNSEILKQLRRELNEEVIDNEFDLKRRTALQEALKTITKDKSNCAEYERMQKELDLPPVNAELWLSLPRVFTRSSARFELPMDSRKLETMTPLDYVADNVHITSSRKLLYNCVFNKFRNEDATSNGKYQRKISGKKLQDALNLMMGKTMSIKQSDHFRHLIDWDDDDLYDFQTFCGLCAVCERLLASEYNPQTPDRKADPCHEIETADFGALIKKLAGKVVDERLVLVLHGIKNS